MVTIQVNDFVELNYTGMISDDHTIFDTTDGDIAKENRIHNKNMNYGPITVCVGKQHVIKGLDDSLVGKEENALYEVKIPHTEAFGKKDAKLIQLIPSSTFIKDKIMPKPGLQVNVDGVFGIVKTVSGGRTLVDFNHPLSGKDVTYRVHIHKKIDDPIKKVESFVKIKLNDHGVIALGTKDNVDVQLSIALTKEIQDALQSELKESIPEVNKIHFIHKK